MWRENGLYGAYLYNNTNYKAIYLARKCPIWRVKAEILETPSNLTESIGLKSYLQRPPKHSTNGVRPTLYWLTRHPSLVDDDAL
jgi:hypothetical protein